MTEKPIFSGTLVGTIQKTIEKMLSLVCTAYGQGYAMLAKNLTYKITSSLKNNFPATFPGGTNPILIQLELDPNVASRYVSVTFAKQVSISSTFYVQLLRL